jgi:hypothetical protein
MHHGSNARMETHRHFWMTYITKSIKRVIATMQHVIRVLEHDRAKWYWTHHVHRDTSVSHHAANPWRAPAHAWMKSDRQAKEDKWYLITETQTLQTTKNRKVASPKHSIPRKTQNTLLSAKTNTKKHKTIQKNSPNSGTINRHTVLEIKHSGTIFRNANAYKKKNKIDSSRRKRGR